MTGRICHGPRCAAPLGVTNKAFCGACWEKLPHELQHAIWRLYRELTARKAGSADNYYRAVEKGKKILAGATEPKAARP